MADETPQPAPADLRAALLLELQTSAMFKSHCLALQKQVIAAADEIGRLKTTLADRDTAHADHAGRLQADIDRLHKTIRDHGVQLHAPEVKDPAE